MMEEIGGRLLPPPGINWGKSEIIRALNLSILAEISGEDIFLLETHLSLQEQLAQ